MRLFYPVNKINKEKVEEALRSGIIKKREYSEDYLMLESTSALSEVEKAIEASAHYTTIKLKADIDCAHCAMEVQEGLKKDKYIMDASFNFQKKLLTVTTLLSIDSIKEKAKEIEDEIVFLDEDDWVKKTYRVEIDCEECALEVEEKLRSNPNIKDVSFNYPKGKLTLTTTLNDSEIIRLSKEAEEDIKFLSEEVKNYVFTLTIAENDKEKLLEALEKENRAKKAFFDKKGRLHVSSSLSEKEIIKIGKSFSSVSFHTSNIEEKKSYTLERAIFSILLLVSAYIFSLPILAIISYIVAGYDVILKAFKNILKGKVFDENFLMSLATIAALCTNNIEEAAAVMIFYQIGEYFQDKATDKSRDSIGRLLDLEAEGVEVLIGGEWKEIEPEEVEKGSIFRVKSGEKIALDAIVDSGEGFIDTRALTGESVPVKVKKGDKVLSGSVNGDSTLILKSTEEYEDSTASKIMKLVEDGESKKAGSEKFISVFSRYYTPLVCLSALLLALISPLFGVSFSDSVYRAAMLLVISCPCALVLSVPLTYFAAMGAGAKNGVLIKGDDALEKMAHISSVAFDKTGTLTEGVFSVQSIKNLSTSKEHLATIAKSLEAESTHPIATALLALEEGEIKKAEEVTTIKGIGIEGIVDGKRVKVGNSKLMEGLPKIEDKGTLVYVTEEDRLLGVYVISDKIKSQAKSTMAKLKKLGVNKLIILSGDRKEIVEDTRKKLEMDEGYGELLPLDKLNMVEKIKKEGTLMYVGDGINDAPTLASADVAIAMGGVGSDSAIEASDSVIMDDDINKIPRAISIAKKTEKIVKENIILSLLVKAIVFILALMGVANMWIAVFADTGVSLLAVANSLRALFYKEK
ncbi:MAG: heavy metal translocating P-type ATPase [Spirochaetales bacterium]|nr:heavy metal translocating P-type ATPase [Spirochaetales bacterium]